MRLCAVWSRNIQQRTVVMQWRRRGQHGDTIDVGTNIRSMLSFYERIEIGYVLKLPAIQVTSILQRRFPCSIAADLPNFPQVLSSGFLHCLEKDSTARAMSEIRDFPCFSSSSSHHAKFHSDMYRHFIRQVAILIDSGFRKTETKTCSQLLSSQQYATNNIQKQDSPTASTHLRRR